MAHPPVTSIAVLTTTVGSVDEAMRLANEIVDRKLAACVQLDAIAASVYRWEGQLRQDAEVRLTIKTLESVLSKLEGFVAEHHPYDLPQLTSMTMRCEPRYGDWVRGEVAG